MTLTPLTIYLWQLADQISGAASILALFAGAILAIVFTIGYGIQSDFPAAAPELKAMRVISGILFPLSIAVAAFTPSSDTVAMMVVIPQITESSVVQKDIPELYNIAIEALKKQIKGNP